MIPLAIAGAGLGLLVSQLNNYTLSPISDERVSEAAGVNSAAGSFGLSFGLAFAGAIMLAGSPLSFTAPGGGERRAHAGPARAGRGRARGRRAGDDQHPARSSSSPGSREPSRTRSFASTPDARDIALQIALLIPLLAGLIGLLNAFRMLRQPDPAPSHAEGMVLA